MKQDALRKILSVLIPLLLWGCTNQTPVSLGSLLEEMTDRDNLSYHPDPYYVVKQFSSYDRNSVAPDKDGWFANNDCSFFLRVEKETGRREFVMMDTDGPGAIVRFWVTISGANAGKGILRIYLDNNPEPAIEGPVFDVLSGGQLTGAPLSMSVSELSNNARRGHNLYLPIPYSKHCKVTYETESLRESDDSDIFFRGESFYYNINYREYVANTEVITYSPDDLMKYKSQIDAVQAKLKNFEVIMPDKKTVKELTGAISAGGSIQADLSGKSAIRMLRFKIDAGNLAQALRSTIMEISFDGKTTVKCPIGDFFGTGYQIRQFDTWYAKVEQDGTMTCFWVMPYQKQCEIKINNLGNQEIKITKGEIVSSPYKWNKNSMYFGSSWKQFTKISTRDNNGNVFDVNFVTLAGKGVYVGDGIVLFNTYYGWWGEGDEKIYVDNESFPSNFGTGTEDYYGYAWCRPEMFNNHPFISQPDGSGNLEPGYTVNLRFRALDALPFKEKIQFDMEISHWGKTIINYAPVTFWYIHPANAVQHVFDLQEATTPVALERKDIMSFEMKDNKMEGEYMNIVLFTGGQLRHDHNPNNGWSENMQTTWSGSVAGSTLEMSFTSDVEKVTNATLYYTKSRNYGIYKISINGSSPVTVNGKNDNLLVDKQMIRNIKLVKGENRIVITQLSPNQRESTVGIDCVIFD